MQKKVLFYIFAILSLFVFGVLIALLYSASTKSDEVAFGTYESNKSALSAPVRDDWAKKLSIYKEKNYSFAVTELFIKIKNSIKKSVKEHKVKKIKIKKEMYRLSINNLNNYSLFCILRVLEDENRAFIIEKFRKKSKIYIEADKKMDFSSISKRLKRYKINYEIKKIVR